MGIGPDYTCTAQLTYCDIATLQWSFSGIDRSEMCNGVHCYIHGSPNNETKFALFGFCDINVPLNGFVADLQAIGHLKFLRVIVLNRALNEIAIVPNNEHRPPDNLLGLIINFIERCGYTYREINDLTPPLKDALEKLRA